MHGHMSVKLTNSQDFDIVASRSISGTKCSTGYNQLEILKLFKMYT